MKRTRPLSVSARNERERLLHELEVHKIELEMQNQALRDDRDQLEQSRARYAELYDFAPVGHVTLGRSGTIEELNLACAALLGKDRRSVRGQPLRTLVAPQSRARLDDHVRACFGSDQPSAVELMVPLAGGGFRAVELVSVPPPSTPSDASTTFHSVMTDISARKRDDARRDQLLQHEHQARVVAESVNRAKEDLLAVVSHELRTPLVPMMMWTKALRKGGMSQELQQRAVDAIDACLQIEVAMIDDLVDVARGQHGKLRVRRRPLDLQPIVDAAIEGIAPTVAAKQIALTLKVDAAPAWVAGDPVRLRQVVGNLLSNAVKFTREAGHVAVSLRAHDDQIVLIVRDDGVGIHRDLLDDVFEPFRQHEQGTTRRHGGLGLGLTIVRQLVEQHGGRVTAESEGEDRGARFTVTLPRYEGNPEADALASPAPPAELTKSPFDLAGVSVLLVEDHGDTREALEFALRLHGAAVTTAVSAADARAALERADPHVLVSDIGMPHEDGYTFVRKLREREASSLPRRRLPAIALTAHTTERDSRSALAAGFDSHVPKPLDFDRLLALIGELAHA